MKKLTLLLATICCSLTFAQEKTYNFEKKLTYKFELPEEYKIFMGDNDVFFNNYYAKNTLLGIFDKLLNEVQSEPFSHDSFLINNNRIFDVYTNSLENNISIKAPVYIEDLDQDIKPYEDQFIKGNGTVTKLNSTQTINNITCNDYQFNFKDSNENESSIVFCADEKNQIDNISLLLPQTKIKGLLLHLKQDDMMSLTLKNITNSFLKVTFDENKETEIFNNKVKELKENYKEYYGYDSIVADSAVVAAAEVGEYSYNNKYEHPFCNLSTYYENYDGDWSSISSLYSDACTELYQVETINSDYLNFSKKSINQKINYYSKAKILSNKEVKEVKKINKTIFKDAENFKITKETESYENPELYDTATPVYESEPMEAIGETYESTYKNSITSPISLAMDMDTSYRSSLPKYCNNIEVPDFKESEFRIHVKNYVSQVCDLYAIPYDENVAIKETIDSMRKSLLEINNKYDGLKKEDKEKLTTFFNSLD